MIKGRGTRQQRRGAEFNVFQKNVFRAEWLAPCSSQVRHRISVLFYPILMDETSEEKGLHSSRQVKPDVQKTGERQ